MTRRSWTGKRDHTRLAHRLARKDGRDFESDVLMLLRVAWPDLVPARPLGTIDRAGVDILHWAMTPPFPLAIQCKGFTVFETELGRTQIKQCLDSVNTFRYSKLEVTRYALVINRNLSDKTFRDEVTHAVGSLERSGRVQEARLLDVTLLLRETFNGAMARLRSAIGANSLDLSRVVLDAPSGADRWLPEVPFSFATLTVDQHHLSGQASAGSDVSDPLPLIANDSGAGGGMPPTLVIGRAGMGKSTLTRRLVTSKSASVVYVPAAAILDGVQNSNVLVETCFRAEAMFDADGIDPEIAHLVSRTVMGEILKQRQTGLVLIIDGLDESVYFTRRGGLQTLFNLLRDVRIPVVMTLRTELWDARRTDFETSFGDLARDGQIRNRRVQLLTLGEWSDECIALLVGRHRDAEHDPARIARLEAFLALVRSGEYAGYYGTIPRTPLFLRAILELVAEHGPRPAGRAVLLTEWARMKVLRDVTAPRRLGNAGREPIAPQVDSAEATLGVAFRVMENAAWLMTGRDPSGAMELLSTCRFDDVRRTDERLTGAGDMGSIVLNTLLVPAPTRRVGEHRLQFAHRTYQEYFLARHVRAGAGVCDERQLPNAVAEWLDELRSTDCP